MKVICAWCKKDLPSKEGPEEFASHGMCKECQEVQLKELEGFKVKRNDIYLSPGLSAPPPEFDFDAGDDVEADDEFAEYRVGDYDKC